MRTFKTLIDKLAFPEGPRWHDGKLYFSDMHAHKVLAVDMNGKPETICEVPNRPSGLGWLPDGRMLVVSMTDRKLMRLERDGLKVHADLSKLAGWDCNDMVVDAKGRAYVGNFGYDLHKNSEQKDADLVMVTPEGKASVAASGLQFPNGTVITRDGKTMIVGESMGRRLSAFDIAADGSLSNRRVWAEIAPALPDGICLDAEGAVWSASPFTNETIRVFEGGRVAERIKTDQMSIACVLGGAEGKTLFLLTAPSTDPEKCRANPASRIEMTQVEVGTGGSP
jgi:sugar lactone lactonase YvrE